MAQRLRRGSCGCVRFEPPANRQFPLSSQPTARAPRGFRIFALGDQPQARRSGSTLCLFHRFHVHNVRAGCQPVQIVGPFLHHLSTLGQILGNLEARVGIEYSKKPLVF